MGSAVSAGSSPDGKRIGHNYAAAISAPGTLDAMISLGPDTNVVGIRIRVRFRTTLGDWAAFEQVARRKDTASEFWLANEPRQLPYVFEEPTGE
jgi:hypothetical protein